eukprot:Awhi_evm1s4737
MFDGSDVASLETILMNNKTVETLNFSYNNFDDVNVHNIADGLIKNKSFRNLDLSDNHFGDKGIQTIAKALSENKVLTHLNISNCNRDLYYNMSDKGAEKENVDVVLDDRRQKIESVVDAIVERNHFAWVETYKK